MIPLRPTADAQAACLFGNTGRLVSLFDMLSFLAHDFCKASSLIGQLYAKVRSGVVPDRESLGRIAGELGMLERACEPLELTSTLAQIRRIKSIFVDGAANVNYADLARDVIEVQIRLNDELQARKLFILTPGEAGYFDDSQFSPKATEYFQDAIFDMTEAAKCYALERPTACVFHLMRVTEYAVQEMARLVGITDPRPNWDPVIRKIDNELKADYADRQFKGSYDLLAYMSTHLQAVKVAWRNRVMHVGEKHTPEEAREIYGATCGLMRYLAENLPKKGPQLCSPLG